MNKSPLLNYWPVGLTLIVACLLWKVLIETHAPWPVRVVGTLLLVVDIRQRWRSR